MSNLQADSVIACLDSPEHIQSVLDASMWAAKLLRAPLGLLHAMPNTHRKTAVDYSGCLIAKEDSHLLNKFTLEEQDSNGKMRDQGRLLLKQAEHYCQQQQGRYQHTVYTLPRHATLAESLAYVDDVAQLIVIGHTVTCKNSLSQLIRAIRCPTLVTPTSFNTPKTALFAFDNSPTCQALLDWLCQSTFLRLITVHIVLVGKLSEANKEDLRAAYAKLRQAGISAKKALLEGRDVSATLLYYQQQHGLELLLTGAFGESRLRELLHGSDTQKMLCASKTPYLLYPTL